MKNQKTIDYSYADQEIRNYSMSKKAKGEKQDCVVRAIATSCSVTYDDAHEFVKKEMGRADKRGTKNHEIHYAMKRFIEEGFELGGKKFKVFILPASEKKNYYRLHGEVIERDKTVKSFIQSHPKGTYFVLVSKHAFTIRDGILIDNRREEFRPTRKVENAYRIIDVSATQLSLF